MKTKIKYGIWAAAVVTMAGTLNARAQSKPAGQTAYSINTRSDYDIVSHGNGGEVEKMQFEWHDKLYKAVLVNEKLTELYVDGEKIPADDWAKYADAIAAIKKQLEENRLQAKKNEEQARLNEIQAKKNEEQAKLNQLQEQKNEEQAKRNEEQARQNQLQAPGNEEQARLNELQEQKNAEQVKLNEIQEKKNEEQAKRNEAQAKLNQLQEQKNADQAVKNQEQEKLNEKQAGRNRLQAEANERFIKQLTADLVNDKVIPDANSLRELKLNDTEMIVNGVKQPDSVYKKYAEKYKDKVVSGRTFIYSNDGIISGH